MTQGSSTTVLTFQTGDRVEVVGETGLFLVVSIDRQRHCADLMTMGSKARMHFGIHLASLRPYRQPDSAPHHPLPKIAERAEGDD